MPKIEYNPMIEPDVRAIIEPIVNRYLWLLPDWLHRLHVTYILPDIGGEESAAAATLTDKDYRFAHLCIKDTFLMYSQEDRNRVIVHEFLHISLSNAIDYAIRTFDDLDKDSPLNQHAAREMGNMHEQGIQDIAHAIVRAGK